MAKTEKAKQPKIDLPFNNIEYILEAAGWGTFLLLAAYSIYAFSAMPDVIPTHFGPSGKPDAFGSKTGYWILPAVAFIMNAGMSVLAFFPHKFNYMAAITETNAEYQYRAARYLLRVLKININLLFFYIQYTTFRTATGEAGGLDPMMFLVLIGVDMIIIIYYLTAISRVK